jgi:hypothetical protein
VQYWVLERYFVSVLDSGFIHNKKEEWGKIGIVCSFLGSFSALLFFYLISENIKWRHVTWKQSQKLACNERFSFEPSSSITSLECNWIIMLPNRIKQNEDYSIQDKKMHLTDLLDLQYHPEFSAVDFYAEFRNCVLASLKKKGDIIKWQNNKVLDEDEQLSPTFEELILINVLSLIDNRLPGHVRDQYSCLFGESESLMDYETDILGKVPTFLTEIEVYAESKSDQLAR